MTDRQTAIQNAVNARAVATQIVNDYGTNSPEALTSFQAAVRAAAVTYQHGATTTELHTTQPA